MGLRLGRGESMQQIVDSMHGAVAEGVATTKAAKLLADKYGVPTPIIQGLYQILFCESGCFDGAQLRQSWLATVTDQDQRWVLLA